MNVVVVDHNNDVNHHTIKITNPYSNDNDHPMNSNYIIHDNDNHDTETVNESTGTVIRTNDEIKQQQQQKEDYDATTTTIHDDDDEICDHHVTIRRTSKVLHNNINDSTPTAITSNTTNTTIVLFYKYFIPSKDSCNNSNKIQDTAEQQHNNNNNHNNNNYYYIHHYSNYYLNQVQQYIKDICHQCDIKKGRILLSYEGINGTISSSSSSSTSSSSSSRQNIQQFIHLMESLDIIQQFGLPPSETSASGITTNTTTTRTKPTEFLFHNIDWKISTPTKSHVTNNNSNYGCIDPFPDLKISIVSEIISTGTTNPTTTTNNTESNSTTTSTSTGITINDMIQYGGGIHISPQQFHSYIQNESNNILLFDIRNTFEYDIGHFVCPIHNHNQNVDENNNNDNKNKDTMNENTSSSISSSYVSAIHPKEMVQFSTLESILDQTIFNNNDNTNNNKSLQNELHTKKILLYCTGGIRCEKASVMFQKYLHQQNSAKNNNDTNNNDTATTIPPINNVYQLSGGIHRYIEQYGSKGFFKGKNFVFDQRIVQYPSDYDTNDNETTSTTTNTTTDRSEFDNNDDTNIVGRCIECNDKYDILCGSRICTVCRDLVLICNHCQEVLLHGEYHCKRHQIWKTCYYTFLDNFTIKELKQQYNELTLLYDGYITKPQKSKSKTNTSEHDQEQQEYLPKKKNYKNIRRTLYKQMTKVQKHMNDMEQNGIIQDDSKNDNNTNRISIIRRCRTCMEPNTICDGKCWGFWKQYDNNSSNNDNTNSTITDPILPILTIGTIVEPGPDWNELRFGTKYNTPTLPSDTSIEQVPQPQQLRRGIVVDVKTWGSNSTEYDCVAVSWFNNTSSLSSATTTSTTKTSSSLIYRWGVIARNGKRMYDLQRVNV